MINSAKIIDIVMIVRQEEAGVSISTRGNLMATGLSYILPALFDWCV